MTQQQGKRVVVIGGGNAGLCAALSAADAGAQVTLLERAPQAKRGGNTAFTAGAMRVAYKGVEDILALVPDLSDEQRAITDFGSYDESQFFDDIARVTRYRANPDLAQVLVSQSFETITGYTADEFSDVFLRLHDFVHAEDIEPLREAFGLGRRRMSRLSEIAADFRLARSRWARPCSTWRFLLDCLARLGAGTGHQQVTDRAPRPPMR